MAQPADTIPPALVEAMRVNAPSGERKSNVEVVGSKERLVELLKKSRPAKAPTRPTAPMRSKSTRGRSARTTLRRAMRGMRYHGRDVVIVNRRGLLTYEEEKVK